MISVTALLTPTHEWTCPNCGGHDTTHELRPHTRFHTCPGLGMLTAPMVPAGTKCKVIAVERGDYTNGDVGLTRDENGKVIQSILTVRDDGMDCAVFAPMARVTRDEAMEARCG